MKKIYKEPNKIETETTINVLYSEKMISLYTNKVDLQKQLCKTLGKPKKEDIVGRSIVVSVSILFGSLSIFFITSPTCIAI